MLVALLERISVKNQIREVSLSQKKCPCLLTRRWYNHSLSWELALLRWDLSLFRWDLLVLGGLGLPLISLFLNFFLPLQRFLGDLVLVDGLGLGCRGLLGRLGFLLFHHLKPFADLKLPQNFLDIFRGLSHSRLLLVIN